ncbi:MAG: hypothetical protein ACD_76C00154G0006 [uncultured bacterium]|nr:MAG: hypothetical protein ACD_76C00154G0006 [uncultured bacterium]HBD05480.1 hypothetical protein [Candidatus Uhrbacteria bacterium]
MSNNNQSQSIEDLMKTGAPKEKFDEKMIEIRIKEREREAETDAARIGVNYVNLKGFPISPDSLRLLPKERAQDLKAIPFLYTGPELRLGALNPEDQRVKDLLFELGERNKTHAELYKISQESFDQAMKLYETLPKVSVIVRGVEITAEELGRFRKNIKGFSDIQTQIKNATVTDLVAVILAAAIEADASDVHIEAEESGVVFRLRIDGVLQDVARIESEKWKNLISRIKLVSGLKINITDRPQDGRYTIHIDEEAVDVRVSTLPTNYGESVVMRLLRPSSIQLGMDKLGIRPAAAKKLEREIIKPHGMIVVTGPTGSGKTTTLYSILQALNKPDVKIITLEDPIEYKLQGINQSQIDPSKEFTFARGLRSVLRQDPDIVMVGEIRDLETAETAIQAALTGHIMLSTIHTNDAAGAVPRFLSIGVKPFLLSPSLNAIVGQRLVRKIHEDCKQEYAPDGETLKRVSDILASIPSNAGEAAVDTAKLKFYKGAGCDKCNMTGYKGRIGIYEILLMDDSVGALIQKGNVGENEMRAAAKEQGMATMAQDGLLKAIEGITSIEEVFRVITE